MKKGKSQIVYCFLLLIGGFFGSHNFYIGRWKTGLLQLIITISSIYPLLFINLFLLLTDVFRMNVDVDGIELKPCKVLKIITRCLVIIPSVLIVIVLITGGVRGFKKAYLKYNQNLNAVSVQQ